MKTIGKALLASSLVVLSGLSAFAADAPFVTYNVDLEANGVHMDAAPVPTAGVTKENVAFRIVNNSGRAAYFVNGTERTYVPVVSQTTVTVPYTANQAYKVVDESGNTLASWHLQGGQVQQPTVQSASAEQYSEWGQRLQGVIENARNRTVSYSYNKTQTTEATARPAQSAPSQQEPKGFVRGFW